MSLFILTPIWQTKQSLCAEANCTLIRAHLECYYITLSHRCKLRILGEETAANQLNANKYSWVQNLHMALFNLWFLAA